MFHNSFMMSHKDMRIRWAEAIAKADAASIYSSVHGGLPPLYSFVEEVLKVKDKLRKSHDYIYWEDLPMLALRSASPGNWEYLNV